MWEQFQRKAVIFVVCQSLQPRRAKIMLFSPRTVLVVISLWLRQIKYPQNTNQWAVAQADLLTLLFYGISKE